jgi:hypothetical protein
MAPASKPQSWRHEPLQPRLFLTPYWLAFSVTPHQDLRDCSHGHWIHLILFLVLYEICIHQMQDGSNLACLSCQFLRRQIGVLNRAQGLSHLHILGSEILFADRVS